MVAHTEPTAEPSPVLPRARLLRDVATLGLVLILPVLMVAANRSSPLVMAISALLATAGAVLHPGLRLFAARLGALARRPEALAGFLFLAWACLSILWSVDWRLSLSAFGELLVPLAAATLLAAALPARLPGWAAPALAVALALVAIGVVIEVRFGFPLRRLWSTRLEDYVMNRPIVTATILLWPAIAALRAGRKAGLALLLFVLVAAGAVVSSSGSSKLSLLVGAAVFGATLAAPKALRAMVIPGLLLAMAIQPAFGLLLEKAIPEQGFAALQSAHARERVDIWIAFGDAASKRLATGTGFGSSPKLDKDPVAGEVAPAHREMLAVGHPHDALLQVWTELGLPGAALAMVLLWFAGRRLASLPDDRAPEALACAAAALAVALESHGAWQGWWIAAAALPVVLFPRFASPPLPHAQG